MERKLVRDREIETDTQTGRREGIEMGKDEWVDG
jgi:hypothetical protein